MFVRVVGIVFVLAAVLSFNVLLAEGLDHISPSRTLSHFTLIALEVWAALSLRPRRNTAC